MTIINSHPAGSDHQVVTVQGGDSHAYRKSPCPTCPWRVDAVGEFPSEAFRVSAHTAYDMAQKTFGCHSSGSEKPATCAGFILRGSTHNLGIRLKLMKREINLSEVSDGGHELFANYREMAEANGVASNDPVLDRCRDD